MSSDNKPSTEIGVGHKLDRYELTHRVGAGGMGLIFKGIDTKLKRQVAIKIISDRVKDHDARETIHERFLNEARAAGGLSHPNLVQIYDFGETPDHTYIVMEYIEGETLEDLLKAKGQLNIEELLKVTREVASALAFAHKKGIVHRDIKPSNIIIEANSGQVKILDFGIAKFVDQEELKLTQTGMVLGSTHYLSPEHITGKSIDGRSDIFSLGTVLYECATGSLPFRGTNSSSILYKIVHFDPQSIAEIRPELSPEFIQIVEKCLKKNPDDRFANCDDLEKAVANIQDNLLAERKNPTGRTVIPNIPLRSYFIRESQIISILKTQNKLSQDQITILKTKPVAETLLRENWMTEDELAKIIADCLDLPWIPRGRLKSIKITDSAFNTVPAATVTKYNILPFFKDEEKKILSFVIDGCSDFQRDVEFAELAGKYQLQFYVSAQNAIRKSIETRIKLKESGKISRPRHTLSELDLHESGYLSQKRVLLVDNQANHHEALIRLFRQSENSLTIASDVAEAQIKLSNDAFDFVWVSQALIGDELNFELDLLRKNPNCEIRYFDSLAQELFQESVTYRKVREMQKKMAHRFLQNSPSEIVKASYEYAALASRIIQGMTENIRIKDEVFFSALFWKYEQLQGSDTNLVDLFDGILRLRYIFDSLQERFDGRGPLGLKAGEIPLAGRVLVCLFLLEGIRKNWKSGWTGEELELLKKKFDQYAGKHLDPMITSAILDLILPTEKNQSSSKIVIIDSDQKYSAQLASQLKRLGQATVYSDGISALAGIKKDKPDLIISEILVSKLDGFSICARLQADESLKKIPMVFVSQSNSPEHSTRALQLGAEDFIAKSSEPRFIIAKLQKMLNKKAS